MGPPGSGKSTQAKSAAKTLGLDFISSGDISREMSKIDEHARSELMHGNMAPEIAIRAEIMARIEAATLKTKNFVIEGFPRRVEQLYILESVPNIKPIYFVIELDMLLCLRRLVARGREEDHPDATGVRFQFYHEHTELMISYLWNHSVRLDGSLDPKILMEQVNDEYHRASNGTA